MLSNIQIVLVNPSHPGNIGSVARAMKTMGLSRLTLVAPKTYPHHKATAMASNADDVLRKARVVDTLAKALTDCRLAVGASVRDRDLSLPVLNVRECGQKVYQEAQGEQVAIVFGNEQSGLSNDELLHCQYQAIIPANPIYSSLNLAAAVQVFCYEVYMASQVVQQAEVTHHHVYATAVEVEYFFQHLEQVLIRINFLKLEHAKRLIPRLKRMFNRIRLEENEVHILRGILTAVEKQGELDES